MCIYFVLMGFWALFYLAVRTINKGRVSNSRNAQLLYAILAGLSMFLVMGLKHYSVGTDIARYLYMYDYTRPEINIGIFEYDEWGYQLFIRFLKLIGVSNQGYIIVTAFIISFSFTLFYYKYSKNVFLSFYLHLTIGLFTMSMSGIRQTLAICFTLLAFHYTRKRKPIGFFASVFVAYTFHNSAIIFLPVYLLRNIKINEKKGYILLMISSAMLFFRKLLVPIMEFLIPGRYEGRYALLSDAYPVNPMLIVISIAIPLACLFFWRRVDILDDNQNELYSILFVMSCINIIYNILSINSITIGRLSYYFVTYNTILIPNIISIINNKKLRIIAIFLCIVLPLIQFVMSTPDGILKIDSYKFFWE